MTINGKIFGLILGAFIAGPLGLVIGLIIGHFYDIGLFDRWFASLGFYRGGSQNAQQIFFNCTFMIMGYLAKADGRVSEKEIAVAQNVMMQMGLNANLRQEAIRLFNQGKQPNFNLSATLEQLKRACWNHPSLMRMFIEVQIQIALAEGYLTPIKRNILESICQSLGIMGFNFKQYEQQYRAEQNYQRYYQQPKVDPQQHIKDAYTLLGVSPHTPPAEIKKAYRRLMSQHHPDKLIAKGVPPEMIKMATQKTQQIQSAYETIKNAKGF